MIRKLSNAVIRDDAFDEKQCLEWKFAMEKLTTQNVTDSINQILEKKLSTLDNAEVERLSLFMGDSLILNGRFVPIKNEKVKEALRIEM